MTKKHPHAHRFRRRHQPQDKDILPDWVLDQMSLPDDPEEIRQGIVYPHPTPAEQREAIRILKRALHQLHQKWLGVPHRTNAGHIRGLPKVGKRDSE